MGAVARIVVVIVIASIIGGAIALAAPTLAGLFVSGVVYLAVIAGLGAILDRPLAARIAGFVPAWR